MTYKLYLYLKLIIFVPNLLTQGMQTHVSNFYFLFYDTDAVHRQHIFHRTSSFATPIDIRFNSHNRAFHMNLLRDNSIFHSNLVVEGPDGVKKYSDISHIYHGNLLGRKNSTVYGSIINGIFRGVIEDPQLGKYYLEDSELFFGDALTTLPRGHSVIYHEAAVNLPQKYNLTNHCKEAKITNSENSVDAFHQKQVHTTSFRKKRQAFEDQTTCLLYLQTDYKFFQKYRSEDAIIGRLAEHVKAVNDIYGRTVFLSPKKQPIPFVKFKISRLKINNTDSMKDRSNPFRLPYIGVEKFLYLYSLDNFDDFCLSYIFTHRDFDDGILGLAWVASPTAGGRGGICEKHAKYLRETNMSLNTGVITTLNYGADIPALVSHLTFAHELGHSLGAAHDADPECVPGDFGSPNGNYIMYAKATTGTSENNDDFSSCSISQIGSVLFAKKSKCFVSSMASICGNSVIEDGEQCDCGFSSDCATLNDTCCTPADHPDHKSRCKLKAGANCSLTQGRCCSTDCTYRSSVYKCAEMTDCRPSQNCKYPLLF